MAGRTGLQGLVKRIRVPLGLVVAGVFLIVARPLWATLLASLPLVLGGLWLRGYAAGYVRKNAELTTAGPYGYTRNPLYLGSMGIVLGFGVAAGSWWLGAVLLGVFLAVYYPTIFGEERYLRDHFVQFEDYVLRVPRLLPGWRAAAGLGELGAFSPALYRHHREYNAGMGAGAIYLALVLRMVVPGWLGR